MQIPMACSYAAYAGIGSPILTRKDIPSSLFDVSSIINRPHASAGVFDWLLLGRRWCRHIGGRLRRQFEPFSIAFHKL